MRSWKIGRYASPLFSLWAWWKKVSLIDWFSDVLEVISVFLTRETWICNSIMILLTKLSLKNILVFKRYQLQVMEPQIPYQDLHKAAFQVLIVCIKWNIWLVMVTYPQMEVAKRLTLSWHWCWWSCRPVELMAFSQAWDKCIWSVKRPGSGAFTDGIVQGHDPYWETGAN